MRILVDDGRDPYLQPTKDNIIASMQWLVSGVQPGDSLFFHYSGHGGQVVDVDGDEGDGFDETILPLDFKRSGMIVDDLMNAILVQPLPPGVRMTVLFDSCHSGTALDLPFVYNSNGQIVDTASITPMNLFQSGSDPITATLSMLMGSRKKKMKQKHVIQQEKGSNADVIMFSSCRDDQLSTESRSGYGNIGAMSAAFIEALQASHQQTYLQLMRSTEQILRFGYQQKPQLSSSHPMNMNQPFVM